MIENEKNAFQKSKRIMSETGTFSFENSRRIMNHLGELNADAERFVFEHLYDSMWSNTKQLTKLVNDVLIKIAEQMEMSLYELCLTTKPIYEYNTEWDEEKKCMNNVTTITLKHIDFELVEGPGYWKDRYFKLKKEMHKLINNE